MGKYKNLLSNTLIFAIGTFGSKLLPFVLLRLYTSLLTNEEYGMASIIQSTCNLILPVMYLCMGEAVIRYGLDETIRKRDVLTTGLITVWTGYAVLLCCYPLMRMLPFFGEYLWLIYIYIIASATHTVVSQFVRSRGLIRLFAADGIFTTLLTVLLNLLLLVRFKLGVTGYVLSTVIADAVAAVFLFLLAKLRRFVRFRGIDYETVKAMLRYSIPLVPTAVFWWITNLSDQYFVKYICGDAITGLYTAAQKFPSMILLVSTIFTQAWQISAFTEYGRAEAEKFYSTVFKSYYTFVFLAASGIIWFTRPITELFLEPRFHAAWQYVPFLVLSVSFSCLVTFLGTIYNAAKKNAMVTITTAVGAIVNIFLNWKLIPLYGAQGAAFATFVSFFIVFAIRAVDTQKLIRIQMQPLRFFFSLALLLIQVWVSLSQFPHNMLIQAGLFALLFVLNMGYILLLVRRFMHALYLKRYPAR